MLASEERLRFQSKFYSIAKIFRASQFHSWGGCCFRLTSASCAYFWNKNSFPRSCSSDTALAVWANTGAGTVLQYGKPAHHDMTETWHEGDSPSRLKSGTPPQEVDCPLVRGAFHPPQEGSFHFALWLQPYRKRNQNCIKRRCLWVSSLHAPIYRNFYL